MVKDLEQVQKGNSYISKKIIDSLVKFKINRIIKMKKLFSLVLIMILISITSTSFAGPKWEIGKESWLKLSFLGQSHFSYTDTAAPEEDFYLRRGRIILSGQIQDGIKFFIETDNDNAGRNGVDTPASPVRTDIQDAFVDFQIAGSNHWIKAGLILLPFSFENKSSAASLLGIDYNAETIKFTNSFVWRDYGAELSGHIDKFEYRIGLFDGHSQPGTKNAASDLRFTGHISYTILGDVQKGWFFSQNQLGKQNKYLAIGLGHDNQGNATTDAVTGNPQDNYAWVFDIQSSFNLNVDFDLMANGAYYDWDNSAWVGNTGFVEAGILYQKKYMGTFKFSVQDADGAASIEDYTLGLHYFIKGQNVRIGLEHRFGDSANITLLGIQFLL